MMTLALTPLPWLEPVAIVMVALCLLCIPAIFRYIPRD